MQNNLLKKATPHLVAFAVIMIAIFVYFTPLFNGKVLKQYDVLQWKATYQEIAKFEKESGERTFWTNSIFSGMPSYLIGASYKGNFTNSLLFYMQNIFKHPTDTIFLLFGCFYILLLTFNVNPWLAIGGALAFTFSSFNFINIDAGHVTKGNAIALIPLVMAGIRITLYNNRLLGSAITGLAVSLQLAAGHLQITYYLLFIIIGWFVFELVQAIKNKTLPKLVLDGVFLAIAAAMGVGTNITGLLATEEYGKYSIRGKSELTVTPTGESNEANSSSGLDKDYALSWSNGVAEPFTLMIPNFYGGASNGELSVKSETYNVLKQNNVPNAKEIIKQMPVYWGDQPFTAGPIYYGAIVVFLFVLGMFIIKGTEKWWIFSVAMLSVFLSMGKNFMPLTDIFFNYFPLYNKFRSVTFILCVAQTLFPLLAILTLKEIFSGNVKKEELIKGLKYAGGIVGGLCVFFILIPGMLFDFTGMADAQLPEWIRGALASDRENLLRMDALRSLIFIAAAVAVIWFSTIKKLKTDYAMVLIGLLILVDLWGVDKRYLNDRDFERKKAEAIVEKTQVDEAILQDPDPHYRVYNNTTDFDKDALTAYYHKSLGGYHGAKMRRYQELIEWHLSKQNMEVYNMLNAKYFIVRDTSGTLFGQRNPFANGNAWFVNEIQWVKNADEEIKALTGLKTKEKAVIDERFKDVIGNLQPSYNEDLDTLDFIKLTSYQPNKLEYECNTTGERLAVFSEIFYDKGWNAYLNDQLVPHARVNYVLRAMPIPPGKHKIVFKFEPKVVETGEKIAYASSIALYLSLFAALFLGLRRKEK
ncbi:MAG: YfhO family protein [Bacteroidia bacterium]